MYVWLTVSSHACRLGADLPLMARRSNHRLWIETLVAVLAAITILAGCGVLGLEGKQLLAQNMIICALSVDKVDGVPLRV
jgi:hypothetical protein